MPNAGVVLINFYSFLNAITGCVFKHSPPQEQEILEKGGEITLCEVPGLSPYKQKGNEINNNSVK